MPMIFFRQLMMMMTMIRRYGFYIILLSFLSSFGVLSQSLKINEVMPSNHYSLQDEDAEYPDWFELKNTGDIPIDLIGYSITDDENEIFKWNFPSFTLNPGNFILVYASGKDKKINPVFNETIINEGAVWKYTVPQQDISGWTSAEFDDSDWSSGHSGFGYGDNDDATTIPQAYSVFLRKTFTIEDTSLIRNLVLHMDYDDAFVAYINDVEVARSNIGTEGVRPAFNETADAYHEALMYLGSDPERFAISDFNTLLKPGENLIAIQVHNFSIGSSDFSAIPFLTIEVPYQPSNSPPDFIPSVSGGFHTNFRIDADGDSLYLYSPQGIKIHEVHVKSTPPDISIGYRPDNYETLYAFTEPTPWQENTTDPFEYITSAALTFDPPGGYHPGSIEVSILSEDPLDTIYYTLNGSEPTRNSTLYKSPLRITEPTSVRAKVFHSGKLSSEVQTVNYYPAVEKDLPLVFLTTDPANLWDYNSGIYVLGPNAESDPPYFGANFWQRWEKPAHIEYFDKETGEHFSIGAGIRIYGNYSRQHPMKSLAVYARSEYGDKSIEAKIFKDNPLSEFEAIVLRNSGNEWFGQNSQSGVLYRDLLMTSIARDINVDAPAGRPVVVYINGEYWGIHNLREKINEHFVADNHGYDPDSINLLEFDGNILEGTNTRYTELLDFIRYNDITLEENYRNVASLMDIDEFIRYCLLEIYYYNGDWPGNNIKYWQSSSDDSPWRWIMFDTDFGFGLWDVNKVYHNTLEFATTDEGEGWPNPPWSTFLLRSLLKNSEFKVRFVNTFADHLNTTLLPDSLISRINKHKNDIENEMYDHIERWGGNYANWTRNVEQMRNFAKVRKGVVNEDIKEHFRITNNYNITLNIKGCDDAKMRINTIKINQFPWSGTYFDHIPVEITAIPPEGYQFVKWEGSINSDTAYIVSKMLSHENLTAVFAPIDPGIKTGVIINEIFYKPTDEYDPGDWLELYNLNDNFVDISGWQIRDNNSNHNFTFGSSFILEPHSYLVVCRDSWSFNQHFPEIENYTGNLNFGFSSQGDCVKLYNQDDELVDSICYGTDYPWPTDPNGLGYSLSLKSPDLDNSTANNWFTSKDHGGSPGELNQTNIQTTERNFTPGKPASFHLYPNPFSSELTINVSVNIPGELDISVLDVSGRTIAHINDGFKNAGYYRFSWNPVITEPGVYYLRIQHSGSVLFKKVIYTH
ncbi:MAG: CotH kinase family protein [Bacteroidales bacterium]